MQIINENNFINFEKFEPLNPPSPTPMTQVEEYLASPPIKNSDNAIDGESHKFRKYLIGNKYFKRLLTDIVIS